MATPGFTAESSVYRTTGRYTAIASTDAAISNALLMQYWCWDCYCAPDQMCEGWTDSHGHHRCKCVNIDSHITGHPPHHLLEA
jgi:hypothetical protein